MAGWTLVLALTLAPCVCPLLPSPQAAVHVTDPAPIPDLVAVFAARLAPGSQVTLKLMDNQVLKAEFAGLAGDRVMVRLVRTREELALPLGAIYSIHAKRGGAVVRP
ncbi:MAG: hypothetical protein HYU53_18575 [Acidobacteria bacterium]|nr:hypothetical protein [Acidobacteriota bacterium]